MGKPNFFLVGTTKGGTSTLHRWLLQHPQVFLPARKELHHFCSCPDRGLHAIRSSLEYEHIFADASTDIVGEASPCYMYYPDVPEAIRHRYPTSRILVSLRDPVERFWSHYLMNEIYLPTGLPPDEILDINLRGESHNALEDLFGVGRYVEQIERLFSVFGREHVFVTFLEHIASSPDVVARRIQEFLDIEVLPLDTNTRDKQYVEPRNAVGRLALRNPRVRAVGVTLLPWRVRRFLRTKVLGDPALKPELPGELRERLQALYSGESARLELLLGEPLPWSWYR